MNQDDYDRILGLVRTQAKPELVRLLRVFRQAGLTKCEQAYALCFLAQGLADDSLNVLEVTNAMRLGNFERKRGALDEFHTPPVRDERIPR
jgi:hypothetical protein